MVDDPPELVVVHSFFALIVKAEFDPFAPLHWAGISPLIIDALSLRAWQGEKFWNGKNRI